MNTSKKVMLVVGAILVVLFIVMMIVENATREPASYEPLDGQMTLMHNAWKNWFGERIDVLGQSAGVVLVCDWMQYKSLVAAGDPGWADAGEQVNADAMDLVMANSLAADFWAENAAFDLLYDLYNGKEGQKDRILTLCREQYPELGTILDKEVEAFHEIARKEGFLDASNRILPEKRDIVHLLHRHLWVEVEADQFPRVNIEPPEERLAFFRWQIEQSSMNPEQKLKKLDQYSADQEGEYDYDFARAMIFTQTGMYGEACAFLKDALEKCAPDKAFRRDRYQRALRDIEQAHPGVCNY